VREAYLVLAAQEADRFVIVDGSGSVEATAAAVATLVLPRLAGV